jgi:hypothetical protein
MSDDESAASISAWLKAIHQTMQKYAEAAARHQEAEAGAAQRQAEAEATREVRLPVEITNYYQAEGHDRDGKEKREKFRTGLEFAGVIVASILAIATLCTLWVFYEQLCAMRKGNADAQKAAQAEIAAAKDNVAAVRTQMRQDERAWIDVHYEIGQFVENKPLTMYVTISDTGKTPAEHIDGRFFVEKVMAGQNPRFGTVGTIFGSGILFPSEPMRDVPLQSAITNTRTLKVTPIRMTSTDASDYLSGKALMVLHGEIRYDDVFGVHHWLRVCLYQSKDLTSLATHRTVVYCSNYNDIDQNQ